MGRLGSLRCPRPLWAQGVELLGAKLHTRLHVAQLLLQASLKVVGCVGLLYQGVRLTLGTGEAIVHQADLGTELQVHSEAGFLSRDVHIVDGLEDRLVLPPPDLAGCAHLSLYALDLLAISCDGGAESVHFLTKNHGAPSRTPWHARQ